MSGSARWTGSWSGRHDRTMTASLGRPGWSGAEGTAAGAGRQIACRLPLGLQAFQRAQMHCLRRFTSTGSDSYRSRMSPREDQDRKRWLDHRHYRTYEIAIGISRAVGPSADLRDLESLKDGIADFLPPWQKETAVHKFARFVADDMFLKDTDGRYVEAYECGSGTEQDLTPHPPVDVAMRGPTELGPVRCSRSQNATAERCTKETSFDGRTRGSRMPVMPTPSICSRPLTMTTCWRRSPTKYSTPSFPTGFC